MYILFKINNKTASRPPEIFNKKTVSLLKFLNEKEINEMLQQDPKTKKLWYNCGYFWKTKFEFVINLKNYKQNWKKNKMIHNWKMFLSYDNFDKTFMRQIKLKNL